jgi:hypothetical protein
MQRISVRKCVIFTLGSVFGIKLFTAWSRKSLMDVRKLQMIPDHVQNLLRQQSKDFYAAGFDVLVKRWDK